GAEGLRPFMFLGPAVAREAQKALRADDDLGVREEGLGARRKALNTVLTHADDAEPLRHFVMSAATAWMTEAAMAGPPRCPRIVEKGTPRGLATSSSLDSLAPMKPTGNPTMAAGLSAPASSASSSAKSAVGALPMTATAPARCGSQSETAAAE